MGGGQREWLSGSTELELEGDVQGGYLLRSSKRSIVHQGDESADEMNRT